MGDRATMIRKNDRVIMTNSAIYAMNALQASMEGEAESAGLCSDEDVMTLLSEIRTEKMRDAERQ